MAKCWKACCKPVAASGSAAQFPVAAYDYPELFHSIASDNVVRRPGAPNARVRIYGPLEARLQQADRVVLAGLAEGVWPPEPRNDPWLNWPMRQELGLDLPERRIGLAAHDFAQALGAKDVFLTYATKREGAPAVISRFVQRLSAVSGPDDWKVVKARGEKYLDWARSLDRAGRRSPLRNGRRRRRRASLGQRGCRLPRSSIGCAIPTRSMRSTFSGSIRSTPSIRRPAHAIAAR